ncbi:MAG: nucleotidyltransferase domain-containing protein [Candidatus Hydrogenedentes bacterium]|nr:nucleotidyltransferase domain-containing protein [Candidatus Hydrogenedentota bacterium]
MPSPRIEIPEESIESFCRKWRIREFSLFGSVLTDDFRPDSDVDVLLVFEADADWGLFEIVEMKDELQALFGREVDLVEKEAISNPFRRDHILRTHQVVYASR